jgi:hypothetical protein
VVFAGVHQYAALAGYAAIFPESPFRNPCAKMAPAHVRLHADRSGMPKSAGIRQI